MTLVIALKQLITKPLLGVLTYTCCALSASYALEQASVSKSQISIIIDDVGAKASDARAFRLPSSVTFSILPNTEYSTDYSFKAALQNREVMLHMPMESLQPKALGEGPLLSGMYPQELKTSLLMALKTVPHAVGVNNHMGSKLTQMTLPMRTVMETLAQNNLFFVDSRTTRFTKAGLIADEFGVNAATRQVFLDHERNSAFIEEQFDALIRAARKNGKAIGIGHPYQETLNFLEHMLPKLPPDIEVITVSEYLQETNKFRINPMLVQNLPLHTVHTDE
ncbi:divergent polysaccharide deacetylase family protein [Ningiella sp. W23]|uniref:divergent polysaccharide deacetylase family protein n=1 Tax=Ningiella sp. W23 TaxID=3023715 RepID=UPI003757F995